MATDRAGGVTNPRACLDRRWAAAPLVTLAAVIPLAAVDIFLLGFAAMASDACDPDRSCSPADQVTHIYAIAGVGTVLGFLATLATRRHTLNRYG